MSSCRSKLILASSFSGLGRMNPSALRSTDSLQSRSSVDWLVSAVASVRSQPCAFAEREMPARKPARKGRWESVFMSLKNKSQGTHAASAD